VELEVCGSEGSQSVPARPSVMVGWQQGKALGSEESKVMGSGLLERERLSLWAEFCVWRATF
jgi:hypothetical protein